MRILWPGLLCLACFAAPAVLAQPPIDASAPASGGDRTSGTPPAVDLQPAFEKLGLTVRLQGARPTCSVITIAGALEFAVAKREGQTPRLSVEFLNWAANQACGDQADGGFFSDLWKGFAAYGICAEAAMPYEAAFDSSRQPSPAALAEAKTRLSLGLRLHWIKEWNVKTGLSADHIASIKRTLEKGWPVCGGLRWPKQEKWSDNVLQMCPATAVRDGHSVLLVGYRDEAAQPGGGVFLFHNSSRGGPAGAMPYAYAREYMNDAVWVDYE